MRFWCRRTYTEEFLVRSPPPTSDPPPLFLQVCKWNFFEIFRHRGGGGSNRFASGIFASAIFFSKYIFLKKSIFKAIFSKISPAALLSVPAALFRSACGALLPSRRLRRLDKQIFFCTSAFFRSVCKCFYYFSAKNLNTTASSKICFLFFLSKNPTPTKRRLQTCTHSINTSTCRHVFQTFLLTTNTSNLIHV